MVLTDDLLPNHVPGGHGFSMDRLPNPRLSLRYVAEGRPRSWVGNSLSSVLRLTKCTGAVPPYIYGDIGGADRWIWFVGGSRRPNGHRLRADPYQVLANLLALAAVCPFVGSLSDLIGRRYVALCGAFFLVLGMVVASTAHNMNIFICKERRAVAPHWMGADKSTGGMTFAGVGAGINELTALAVTSELAPTRKRGKYVAILVFTILPFTPSVLWAQLIASHSNWRYCGALCGAWAAVGFIMTAIFYFPPPRANSHGLTKREIIGQIDYVGGFLSISGMLLFMAGKRQHVWMRLMS